VIWRSCRLSVSLLGTWIQSVSDGWGCDGELGDVEADDPDWRSADGDLAGDGFLDSVVGPSGGESLAFVRQCLDEFCESLVCGMLGCGGAELAEDAATRNTAAATMKPTSGFSNVCSALASCLLTIGGRTRTSPVKTSDSNAVSTRLSV